MNKGPQKPEWTHWISVEEIKKLNATFDKEHAKEIAEIQEEFKEPKEMPGFFYGTRPALESDIAQAKLVFENTIKEKTQKLEAKREEAIRTVYVEKLKIYAEQAKETRHVVDTKGINKLSEEKARRKEAIDQADLLRHTYLSDQCEKDDDTLIRKWGEEIQGFTQEGLEKIRNLQNHKLHIRTTHEIGIHASQNPDPLMTNDGSKATPTASQLRAFERNRGLTLVDSYYKEIAKTQKDNPNYFSIANSDGDAVGKTENEETQVTEQVAKMKI